MKIKYKILFTFLFCVLFFANVKESRTEEVINLETEKSVIDIENESISAADGVLLKYGDISIKSLQKEMSFLHMEMSFSIKVHRL